MFKIFQWTLTGSSVNLRETKSVAQLAFCFVLPLAVASFSIVAQHLQSIPLLVKSAPHFNARKKPLLQKTVVAGCGGRLLNRMLSEHWRR